MSAATVAANRRSAGEGAYDVCELLSLSPVPDGTAQALRLRAVLAGPERAQLVVGVVVTVVAHLLLVCWLVVGPPRPGQSVAGVFGLGCLVALVLVECVRMTQAAGLCLLALLAADPVAMSPPAGLRVAALTTIVPSVEPLPLVRRTLVALGQMAYAGPVDVWVLDEGGDPAVAEMAASLGVGYFTRYGRADLNTERGRFRVATKAGNHNAWFADHGTAYDVVAQVDPDHVPHACFLAQTLGYFRDPDVGFVVAPQVYGDAWESLARHGAAAQGYLFHGVVQRGANRLGAPLLIGTNHVYRTETWAQVGGYKDSVIEDHLTSMIVQPLTGPQPTQQPRGVPPRDLGRPVGPPALLREEVRPGARRLPDRQHVGRVNPLPPPPGGRVGQAPNTAHARESGPAGTTPRSIAKVTDVPSTQLRAGLALTGAPSALGELSAAVRRVLAEPIFATCATEVATAIAAMPDVGSCVPVLEGPVGAGG